MLLKFAKAMKGFKTGDDLADKNERAHDNSLRSSLDSSIDADSHNSSRNWLLSPSTVLRVLYPILPGASKVYADMTIMYTERFRSENYYLREFSWYPSTQLSSAARHTLEFVIGYEQDMLTRVCDGDTSDPIPGRESIF